MTASRRGRGGRRGGDHGVEAVAGSSGLCHRGSMDRRETERLLDAIRAGARGWRARGAGHGRARQRERLPPRRHADVRAAERHATNARCRAAASSRRSPRRRARVIATGEPGHRELRPGGRFALGPGHRLQRRRRHPHRAARTTMRSRSEWLTVLERGDAAVLVTPLSGVSGRMIVRGTGDDRRRLDRSGVEQRGGRSCPRAPCARRIPQSGPERIGSSEVFFEISDAAARARDLRRRTRRRAAGAAGLDARVRGDRRRCPRGVPDGRSVSRRDAGVRAFQPVRRARAAAARQLRAGDEPPRRARSGEPALRARIGGRLHRRARAPLALRQAAGRPGGAGLRARPGDEPSRVRSPVGLSLGAETPEEVAVSILGEILAIRRGFEGGFLSGSVGSLHRPEDRRLLASS